MNPYLDGIFVIYWSVNLSSSAFSTMTVVFCEFSMMNNISGGTFFIGFIIEYLAKLNAIILIIYSRRPFNVVCELRVFALKGF